MRAVRGKAGDERGIILEIDGRDAVVLTPVGDFRRVRLDRPGRQVGEEIPLTAPITPRAPRYFLWPGAVTVVAAAALLALVILPAAKQTAGGPDLPGTGTVVAQVVAYVTVDINPSFELAVDGSGRVISARALNGDAETILALVDLAGRPVDEAVTSLAESAAERGFLAPERENNVVIAAVPAEGNREMPRVVRDRVEAGRGKVKEAMIRRALTAEVVALAAQAPELKEEAARAGISVGKYLILLEMQKSGVPVTAEDLRERPIGKLIKEHGLVPGEVIRRAERQEEMKELIEDFKERRKAERRRDLDRQEDDRPGPERRLDDKEDRRMDDRDREDGRLRDRIERERLERALRDRLIRERERASIREREGLPVPGERQEGLIRPLAPADTDATSDKTVDQEQADDEGED